MPLLDIKGRLIRHASGGFDRAVTLAARASSRSARGRSRAEGLGHEQRLQMLSEIADLYRGQSAGFFRPAREISPVMRHVKALRDGAVTDLAWSSDYEPVAESVRERFGRYRANQMVSVRVSLHEQPRPMVVAIHGYLGGNYTLEQRAFGVPWLYKLGLDVALFTLPFHGVRQDPTRSGPPPFPSNDPRMTVEGFGQAVADLTDLIAHMRRTRRQPVGVMGMSLGGYTTSLVATAVDDLAFAVPMIPLASMADFARDQGRLGANEVQQRAQHLAVEDAHRIVSPLARPPKVAPDRVLVIAAEADRITPVAHARRLASHFRAPLVTWQGGHLLQVGRRDAFKRLAEFWAEHGLISSRR